jgi:homoserine acetyltransferase
MLYRVLQNRRQVPRGCSRQSYQFWVQIRQEVYGYETNVVQDIAASFGGSLERVAATVHIPALIVVNRQDHLVNPTASIQFATLLKTHVLELDRNCGHRAHRCEQEKIGQAVNDFLQQ